MGLDDILKPDNHNDDKGKIKKDDSTKNRLNDLKELLKSDSVQLDTTNLLANTSDFPAPMSNAKYIDYAGEEKTNHIAFATQVITNIIETYFKFELSPRQKDLRQKDILKYSKLLLLVQISEANLIQLQESINGGDMSKEMFDSVNKCQKELRDNMEAEEKHLDKCEIYWSTNAENYGLQNDEEKIVQASEDAKDGEEKLIIMDMSKLSEIIQDNILKEKEKNKSSE